MPKNIIPGSEDNRVPGSEDLNNNTENLKQTNLQEEVIGEIKEVLKEEVLTPAQKAHEEIMKLIATLENGEYQIPQEQLPMVASYRGDYNLKAFPFVKIIVHHDPLLDCGSRFENGEYYASFWESTTTNTVTKKANEYKREQAHKKVNESLMNESLSLSDKINLARSFINTYGDNKRIGAGSVNISSYYDYKKVNITFPSSTTFDINPNLCSDEELFWLLDQPVFSRDYGKFEILSALSGRRTPEGGYRYSNDVSFIELMPCLGEQYNALYKENQIQFPLSGAEVKDLFDKYDNITTSIEHGVTTTFPLGLFGVKHNTEKKVLVQNPNNWIKTQQFTFGESLKRASASEYKGKYKSNDWKTGPQDVLAYAQFLGQSQLPAKGSVYEWSRVLDAKFGKRDWTAGITNNSYRTHNYGSVGSYSGSQVFEFEDCQVKVFGIGPSGDAWSIYQEGGIYFEIVQKNFENKSS